MSIDIEKNILQELSKVPAHKWSLEGMENEHPYKPYITTKIGETRFYLTRYPTVIEIRNSLHSRENQQFLTQIDITSDATGKYFSGIIDTLKAKYHKKLKEIEKRESEELNNRRKNLDSRSLGW